MTLTLPRPAVRSHSYDLRNVQDTLDRRRLLGLGALAPLTLSACSSDRIPAESSPGATRQIEHPLGSADIPTSPRRVIALDSGAALQTALEAGVPLIASETLQGRTAVPPYLPQPGEGFTALGFNDVNFELIASLRPDLIIGSRSRLEEPYQKLTQIAPTVSFRQQRGPGRVDRGRADRW